MSKEKLLQLVEQLAAPLLSSMGLQLWGIELGGMGRPVLRVFVDAANSQDQAAPSDSADTPDEEWAEEGGNGRGVTINQCSELSRQLGLALEVEDVFADAWELEVSSPGLERVFFHPAQMLPFVGSSLDLTLWEPVDEYPARRKFRGELIGVEDPVIRLQVHDLPGEDDPVQLEFEWPQVRKARLIHIFPDTSKPGSGKEGKAPNAGKKGGGKNK